MRGTDSCYKFVPIQPQHKQTVMMSCADRMMCIGWN